MISSPVPAHANTRTRYGWVARAFHWLTALLILTAIGLALYAETLSRETAEGRAALMQVFSIHKTIGVAAFFTALLRILWALSQPRPVPLHPARRAETFLAEFVHWSLYGAMLVMPLSGWLYHSATEGFAQILWPLPQSLPFVPKSESLAHAFEMVHKTSVWVLYGAIGLHVAGALKHALIDRDATLARMTRGVAAGPAVLLPEGIGRRWVAPLLALVLWGWTIAVALTAGDEINPEDAPAAQTAAAQPPATEPAPEPAPAAAAPAAPAAPAPTAPAPNTPETGTPETSTPETGTSPAAPAEATPPETAGPAALPESAGPAWSVTDGALALSVTQMGAPVAGALDFEAAIRFDPARGTGALAATLPIASLRLGSVSEDAKGAAFFDAAAFPTATVAARITPATPQTPKVGTRTPTHVATGTLTLKGVTKPLVLPLVLDIAGDTAKAEGQTLVDRRDFGIGQGYDDEATVAFPVIVTLTLTARKDG